MHWLYFISYFVIFYLYILLFYKIYINFKRMKPLLTFSAHQANSGDFPILETVI